jgi:ferric-dicitrate binding protein FerR (iron transport regulator)
MPTPLSRALAESARVDAGRADQIAHEAAAERLEAEREAKFWANYRPAEQPPAHDKRPSGLRRFIAGALLLAALVAAMVAMPWGIAR